MDTLTEKTAAARLMEQNRLKHEERIAQVAHAVLATDDGRELLAHLCRRVDITGRIFIPGDKSEVNALRAAVRDGERAIVRHLLDLCRKADKNFPIPL